MNWQRFALTSSACIRFLEDGAELDAATPLQEAPPWRQFMGRDDYKAWHEEDAKQRWRKVRGISSGRARQKAESYVFPSESCRELVLAVNAAIGLRRPLLVTGLPGSGKTSLAFVIAAWLGLGPVLEWSVAPGELLADALATYNPLARLQDLEIATKEGSKPQPVERFVRLGPVGTAFLPSAVPRVLLIDEIDKGDLNLANELLHLFEEGRFEIPELKRAEGDQPDSAQQWHQVDTWDQHDGQRVPARIRGGQVQCHEFPLVVMSSNGERDFPPAFNRRCLRVTMPDFSRNPEALRVIVHSHLKLDQQEEKVEQALKIFADAVEQQQSGGDALATDQLLNLVYLMDPSLSADDQQRLQAVLLQGLNSDPALSGDGVS
jgi:MoxR-like ATPase